MHTGGQEIPALSPILFPFGFLDVGREAFDLQRADQKILCGACSRNDLKILTLEVSQTNGPIKSSWFYDPSPSQEMRSEE